MKIRIWSLFILIFLYACEDQNTGAILVTDTTRPIVLVTNYPLYFFASEIGGDVVDVRMPEITGDPAMWVPESPDLLQMQNARLVFLNGAGYESWLAFTSLPTGLTVDTTAGIQDRLLPIENTTVHQHGPGGAHSHEGTAFTTWLDPEIAIEQARVISRELTALVPAQASEFERRLAVLEGELLDLDQSLTKALSELDGQLVVFSHPVYQYLQQRYKLNARSVHWEPDTEPGIKQWVDFQNMLRDHPARLMIWEGQPLQETIERLQLQGIKSIVFDPVANRPANDDYFAVMKANLEQLETE